MLSKKHLRLVLIGKTGVGKSKTGNVILNNGNQFSCGSRGSSVTQVCKTFDDIVSGRWVTVVGTPGLFDTQKNNREVLDEITKCILMTAPGPHAFLFIVRIGRFKIEDKCILDLFVKHFGDTIFKFMVVIFTHYDDWKRDMENDYPTINDFINTLPSQLQSIIKNKCNNRIVALDNTLKGLESRSQVAELITIIDIMNGSNRKDGKEYYSNVDYEKAFIVKQKEVLREKHLFGLQRLREKSRVQKLIKKAVDEEVKNRLGEEQEKLRLKMEEQMDKTNIQRNIQRKPERIIVLKNILENGSAGLGILGDFIPGQVGIGLKIVCTVGGFLTCILNSIYN